MRQRILYAIKFMYVMVSTAIAMTIIMASIPISIPIWIVTGRDFIGDSLERLHKWGGKLLELQ